MAASGVEGADSAATIKRISDAILCAREELEDLLSGSSDFVFTQFSDSFLISTEASHAARRFGLSQFAFAMRAVVDCFLGSECCCEVVSRAGSSFTRKNFSSDRP
jgi:hypothetical protein